MIKFLRNFFHLSNSEIKGVFVLLFLIIIIGIAPRIYYHFNESKIDTGSSFINWVNETNRADSIEFYKDKELTELLNRTIYFTFDPNTVSYLEMKKLGFDSKVARILIKFREKGAKFYSKKDLLKIYGLDEKFYSTIENYIIFPTGSLNKKKKYSKKTNTSLIETKLFLFDPNTVSYNEMIILGIDSKTARILEKYRKKGAIFKTKKDLLKVYGFTESLYNRLKENIIFPEKMIQEKILSENFKIEMNKADTLEFMKLKGVGSYISKEILKYRKKLGGFYKIEQLKEVYGITEIVFKKNSANLEVDNSLIKKINLNQTNFKGLIKHPYLNKKQTISILKLKKEIGGFNKIEDLLYYNTLSESEYEQIKNYLIIE